MRTLTSVAAVISISFVDLAAAQDATPTATHFHEYSQALERGDLAGAEVAARAALEASQQSDGEGGRTALLAFNLARVRAQLGQWQEARAPAEEAYSLSRRGVAGLDPAMSELLWGRVRVATEGLHGADFLSNALERDANRTDLIGDRYDAADQLGLWAMQTRNYLIARAAWSQAADAAQGAPFDQNYARGRARAYEGMAIALQSMRRDLTMSPMERRISARQVHERLREAHELVRPFAFADSAELTGPQELYAQILAWDAAVWSKMASEDPARLGDPQLDTAPLGAGNTPFCAILQQNGGQPFFPAQQAREGQLSAVVLRLRFDEQGRYLGASVAAAVGADDFARNVATAAANATYVTQRDGGCRVSPIQYQRVTFVFRN